MAQAEQHTGSFWASLPGLITAVGGFIGAVVTAVVALHQAGIIHVTFGSEDTSTSSLSSPGPGDAKTRTWVSDGGYPPPSGIGKLRVTALPQDFSTNLTIFGSMPVVGDIDTATQISWHGVVMVNGSWKYDALSGVFPGNWRRGDGFRLVINVPKSYVEQPRTHQLFLCIGVQEKCVHGPNILDGITN